MDTIKAVCTCRNLEEGNTVLALKQNPFAFIEKWDWFTWLMVLVLVLATGALWIGGIIGAHFQTFLIQNITAISATLKSPKSIFAPKNQWVSSDSIDYPLIFIQAGYAKTSP